MTNREHMTTSEIVDEILRAKRMSRRKLALAAGISPTSLQSAMARGGDLSLRMLMPLLEVLGCPIEKISQEWGVSEELVTYVLTKGFDGAEERNEVLQVAFILNGWNVKKQRLLQLFDSLNYAGKREVIKRIEELTMLAKYRNADEGEG